MVLNRMIKITDFLIEKVSPSKLDPIGLGQAYWKFWRSVMKNPGELMAQNIQLAADQVKLLSYGLKKASGKDPNVVAVSEKGDRRFKDPAWSERLMFDMLRQSYLLTSQYTMKLVGSGDLDQKQQHKVDFFTRQMVDAMSPANFAVTNPEVLKATIDSKGVNLVKGMKNLVRDLVEGKGQLKISMVDKSKFEVGKNIASTPGKVVYQNEMMQLVQYTPTTDKVYRRPLVIYPPWINKFYILDLSPKNSFIQWAVSKGYTVFVVSWINPDEKLSQKTFEDYMNEGIFAALDAIEAATGEREVNAIGYCIGGTLLSCALSQMAITGDTRIHSATFFTAQVDFSEAGDLMVFIDEDQLDSLDRKMDKKGYLDASDMAMTFNMLRSNDLIWSFVVNNYLLGRSPAAFDLLYWNNDSTRMPVVMHRYYLREMYLKNKLVEPGGITLNGIPVYLSEIKIPVFLQSSKDDHIAPYHSVYKASHHYSGPVTFMLAGSGHIAGVINSPEMNKYYYYTNPETPGDVEKWIESAEYHEGSWWPYWHQWLYRKSGAKVPARIPGDGALDVIEDAPGSYVKMS
jgi:polyhydroxyalkanoate synthase